jgi:sucrose phosphorylase
MIGTGNDPAVVKKTGQNRDINRTVIHEKDLDESLEDPASKLSLIRKQFRDIALIRVREKAFHPNGEQRVFMVSPNIFSLLRISPDGSERILTLTNVTGNVVDLKINTSELGDEYKKWYDLINRKEYVPDTQVLALSLKPYDVVWLKARG